MNEEEFNTWKKGIIDMLEEARIEYNIGKKFQHETMLKFNRAASIASEAKTMIISQLY